MIKNKFIYLLIIFLVAIAGLSTWLRFVNYETSPPGFTTSEAKIALTSLDKLWLKSTSPVYSMVSSPVIFFLGNNEFSIRLLSRISGILLSFILGIFAYLLWQKYSIAILVAALVAVSPWAIELSRIAFPQMLSLTLGISGLSILFVKNRLDILGYILIFLSCLTHPATLIILPLLTLLLLYHLGKLSWKIGIFFLLLFSGVIAIYSHQLNEFYYTQAFYKEIGFVNRINELRGYLKHSEFESFSPLIFNKLSYGFTSTFNRYLMPWDWYWLFHHSRFEPSLYTDILGKFYFWELVLFLAGVVVFYRNKINQISSKKQKYFIFTWIMIASLPGILKYKPDFSETFFWIIPIFYLLSAYGLVAIFISLPKIIKYVFPYLILIIYTVGLTAFMQYYLSIFPLHKAVIWEYGYKQAANILHNLPTDYSYQITDRLGGDPRVQFTFFDPELLNNRHNILIASLNKVNLDQKNRTVIMATPEEIPTINNICLPTKYTVCPQSINQIIYPNGQLAAYIVVWYE